MAGIGAISGLSVLYSCYFPCVRGTLSGWDRGYFWSVSVI